MSKKRLTPVEQKRLLAVYHDCCVEYYKSVNDKTFQAVVEAEHYCNTSGIRASEVTKVRFAALHEVENNEK